LEPQFVTQRAAAFCLPPAGFCLPLRILCGDSHRELLLNVAPLETRQDLFLAEERAGVEGKFTG
ncbi:MAG: hypothetical protein ACKOUR_17270, partial [Planctomycetota bacterium]